MLRPTRLRVPAAVAAAGTLLLSACAAAGTTTGRSGLAVPTTVPTSPAVAAAASTAATSPAAGSTSSSHDPRPTSAVPKATPTHVYSPTASSWASLVVGGTVTTTAAIPSITPRALAAERIQAGPLAARAFGPDRPTAGKTVYLTFDDGPSPEYTRQVLKLLDEYDAKATFFVIGRQVHGIGADLVREEYAAGHGVGNHTWDHRSLRHTKKKLFEREVLRTQHAVKKATGHAPTCLRPPGGAIGKETRARAKQIGLKIALWNVDPDDWRNPKAKTIAARVLHATHDGSTILMHDGGGNRARSVHALRTILRTLKARGYTFATMCR